METIDGIKMHEVIVLCRELHALPPDDPHCQDVRERLERLWRSLSPTEQDEVDRILGHGFSVRTRANGRTNA